MFQEPAHYSMASLMERHSPLLCGLQDLSFLLQTWAGEEQRRSMRKWRSEDISNNSFPEEDKKNDYHVAYYRNTALIISYYGRFTKIVLNHQTLSV